MSHFATPIHDVIWGGESADTLEPSKSKPEPFAPQLLYPSSAPPPIDVPAQPLTAPKAALLQPAPPPPVAMSGTSRSDMLSIVLVALVIALLIFSVHLNSKVNSLQMMLTILASRGGVGGKSD